jgi:hypothetical protein
MKSTMRLSTVGSVLALAGALAFSGQVAADQVRADYLSHQGGNITTTIGGGGGGRFTFDRTVLRAQDSGPEFQGTLNSNGGPTNLAGSDDIFYAFCLEPGQTLTDPNTYNVTTLQSAPNPGAVGAMGADRAKAMRILFGNVLPDFSAGITTETAIALQIAVWEIANENQANPLNVTTGTLQVTNQTAARALAQTWLDNITNGVWTTEARGLIALTSATGQDFVAQVVPIPAAAWLFGSALLGVAALGRRRRKDEEADTVA